jgi:hypothetical protein
VTILPVAPLIAQPPPQQVAEMPEDSCGMRLATYGELSGN